MEFNGKTLLSWGWQSGPAFAAALAKGKALIASNPAITLGEIQAQLEPLKPVAVVRQPLRKHTEAAPLKEAITAHTPDEVANLESVRQLMGNMMRVPVVTKGAIMPDACPAGGSFAAITVGGAIALKDAIMPAAHSADIACSMYCTLFPLPAHGAKELIQTLRSATRFGAGGRHPSQWVDHPVLHEPVWSNPFLQGLKDYAAKHMADQGDGNHFAYLGRLAVTSELIQTLQAAGYTLPLQDYVGRDVLALVTHHGSRGLGAQVYKRGQEHAEEHTAKVASDVPSSAVWMDANSKEGQAYWDALQYVSRWTRANHQVIHERFAQAATLAPLYSFGNEHNFVWRRSDGQYYHGKGATPAWSDEQGRPLLGLIPLNMAAPILLVLGRSNEDFLGFAPHGAGRNLSRSATINKFRLPDGTLDEAAVTQAIAQATQGIEVEWYYNKPDLSETPLGYKNAQQVIEQIRTFDLATIAATIQPLGCIMAGDSGPPPWKRKKEAAKPSITPQA